MATRIERKKANAAKARTRRMPKVWCSVCQSPVNALTYHAHLVKCAGETKTQAT